MQHIYDILVPFFFLFKSKTLPLARSLTDFPHTWILPIIPILLRIILDIYRLIYLKFCTMNNIKNKANMRPWYTESSYSLLSSTIISRLLDSTRRLLLYHFIMQFRGWGLYVVLEKVEDLLIWYYFTIWTPTTTTAQQSSTSILYSYPEKSSWSYFTQSFITMQQQYTHHQHQPIQQQQQIEDSSTCWYSSLLLSSPSPSTIHSSSTSQQQSSWICQGREFDFSDHVVYFYSHVLPLLLFEAIFCFLVPFRQKEEEDGNSIVIPDSDSSSVKVSENNKLLKPITFNTSTSVTTETIAIHHHHHENHTHHKVHLSIPSIVSFTIHIHIQVLHSLIKFTFYWILPPSMALAFIYFTFLTFLAVYTTAAVFHTIEEVIVGYIISLVVQIPLGILLCTENWSKVRSWIGLGCIQTLNEKVDNEKLT